jgi:hypothetical protein
MTLRLSTARPGGAVSREAGGVPASEAPFSFTARPGGIPPREAGRA